MEVVTNLWIVVGEAAGSVDVEGLVVVGLGDPVGSNLGVAVVLVEEEIIIITRMVSCQPVSVYLSCRYFLCGSGHFVLLPLRPGARQWCAFVSDNDNEYFLGSLLVILC